jgi:rare lipoprotein A
MEYSAKSSTFPRLFSFALMLGLFGGCSVFSVKDGAPDHPPNIDINKIPNAVPQHEPLSKYGNPETYEVFGKTYRILKTATGYRARGRASWYGTKFHGQRTSSGELYDMYKMTAAHKTLPLPSYVKVRNLDNGREVIVKVNDRGPFHEGRIIDLSYVAAKKLGVLAKGTANVEVSVVSPSEPQPAIIATSLNERYNDSLFVQVGSFALQENARRLQQKLRAAEIESGIQIAGINGMQRVFRVRVGPFNSRESAGRVAKNLIEMGLREVKVISD